MEVAEEICKFKIARNRMFSAFQNYHLWKWLSKSININEVGREKAERNVEIIDKYCNLFQTVRISSYKTFIIDLSIFFDKNYKESLSVKALLDEVKELVSKEIFEGVVKEIETIKSQQGKNIHFLSTLRTEDVAHQTLRPVNRVIEYNKVEEMFSATQKILDILSKHYNDSSTEWGHVEEGIDHHLTWVFDNLERGENSRQQEIKDRYKIT